MDNTTDHPAAEIARPQLSAFERTLAAVRALSCGQLLRPRPVPVEALAPQIPGADAQDEAEKMKWLCLECNRANRPWKFFLPLNIYPEAGCPTCHSHQILDCNVTPVKVPGLGDAPWLSNQVDRP